MVQLPLKARGAQKHLLNLASMDDTFKAELYHAQVHLTLLDFSQLTNRTQCGEMKLTSIDFSQRVAEDSRSSWLQTLGNQLINHSPYIRYTNHKYYLL